MKKAMINYVKREKFDNIYTPKYAVKPLIKYLKQNNFKIIWECCDPGHSNITKMLKENDFDVISSDIETEQNFFEIKPKTSYDCIITNPPYSLKDEFFAECFRIGKPFCLLVPLTSLEGIKRSKMFREYSIDVLLLDKRVEFMSDTGKNGCWFNTSWFCYKVLPKTQSTITFHELIKE